jgi:hypothetical protein
MNTTLVIASGARQSSTLGQPLDCRVAALLAMMSSLRVFASSNETNTQPRRWQTFEIGSRGGAEAQRFDCANALSSLRTLRSLREHNFTRAETAENAEEIIPMPTSLRASAPPREPQLSFHLMQRRKDAKWATR